MPQFRRGLSPSFVKALIETSFWPNICADRSVQPEIRSDRLTIYHAGRALVRELQHQNGRFIASVHHKFVPLSHDGATTYHAMTLDGTTGFSFDASLQPQQLGTADKKMLNAYKRMLQFESGPEDQVVQKIISLPANQILDQQVELPIDGSNRIDLCHVDVSLGKIVFVEVKRVDDARLFVPDDQPETITQLKAYQSWLSANSKSVAAEYAKVVRLKRDLGLQDRLNEVPVEICPLETRPVLLIGNCNTKDVERFRAAFRGADTNEWSPLIAGLQSVCLGVILCGENGCDLAMAKAGRQKFRFTTSD